MRTVIYYVADDGTWFMNERDCFAHEARKLFNTGALEFYDKSGHQMKLENAENGRYWDPFDNIYNRFYKVVVDRNNEHVNKLIEMLVDDFGWVLLEPLLDDNGTEYTVKESKHDAELVRRT